MEIRGMKLLIIRFSSIGDIVLTTPVVRCLKQQVPGVVVHYLTKNSYRGIVETNPYIDKVLVLHESWELLLHQLETEAYDGIIDLHKNLRTWKVKRALKGIKSVSFDKLNIRKWLLTALKINRMPEKHLADRYLDTVKSFGVANDGKGLDYFIPAKDRIQDQDLPLSHRFGYIGVVIGAALHTKKLPVHQLKALCDKISYPIVLLGGKEDRAAGEAISAGNTGKIYNACGRFNLNESADLVRHANLIVTHDTGLMHIAAAFKKPMISVWGNTVPAFGMSAYYGMHPVKDIRKEITLGCRPCSKIGYRKCPRKHFKCMELQDMDQISAEAASLWEKDNLHEAAVSKTNEAPEIA